MKNITLEVYRGLEIKADTYINAIPLLPSTLFVRIHVGFNKIDAFCSPGFIRRLLFKSTLEKRIRKGIKKARRHIDKMIKADNRIATAQHNTNELLDNIALEDKNGLLKAQSMAREPNGRNDRNR